LIARIFELIKWDLLWEHFGEHLQAFEEGTFLSRKGGSPIAAVPNLEEGLNRLFDGFSQ